MEDIIFRPARDTNSDNWAALIGASVAFRRDLHRRPELPWQEENTAAAIRASLDALNIPYEKLVSRTGELEKHKAKTIIVVDAMGQHAGTACRELQKAGFTAAKLSGGISSWRGDNLPVVK